MTAAKTEEKTAHTPGPWRRVGDSIYRDRAHPRVGNTISYAKSYPDGETESVTGTITQVTVANWTRSVRVDNGDEIHTHYASPPSLANDPYCTLVIKAEGGAA